MRHWTTLLLLLLVPALAQEGGFDGPGDRPKGGPAEEPFGGDEGGPGPGEEGSDEDLEATEELPPGADAARAAFDRALAYQRKGKWLAAKRAFRKFLTQYPDHPLAAEAHLRGGDNALLGVERIWESGPPERRIDVAVMGDGFTIDATDQQMQEKWAKLCLDVLWNEKVYEEYKNYFNYYFVRLASFEEGVDPSLSPEELKKAQERNLRRRRDINYKLDYSTALDCKAAGPQGQVMADPALVHKWLEAANKDLPGCGDDKFVIAFARFGILGMGGGGIANVGRPDKSITVHEFGHAFSRLLDEYAINPNPPEGLWARTLLAANAYPSPTEPRPDEVPWAHMLRKKVKGVGVYEGGATFQKGVWKPARTCAMNVGGNQYCPVCREQTILVIYEYVSPIDEVAPDPGREVDAEMGGEQELVVLPMQPRRHKLKASWYVDVVRVTTEGGEAAPEAEARGAGGTEPAPEAPPFPGAMGTPFLGSRAQRPRDEYGEPPRGQPSPMGAKARKGRKGWEYAFPLGKLPAGRFVITVEVSDDTDMVVKDEKHLLKERVFWRVDVAPAMKPAPPSRTR